MTPEKVRLAMAEGVGFVCANCKNYWKSEDSGMGVCDAAVRGKQCGGPMVGLAFPEYDGPLGGYVSKFCFVCGDKSRYAARGKCGNTVGVCAEHTKVLKEFSRPGERPKFVTGENTNLLE